MTRATLADQAAQALNQFIVRQQLLPPITQHLTATERVQLKEIVAEMRRRLAASQSVGEQNYFFGTQLP